MKKLIVLLLCAVTLVACSDGEDSTTVNENAENKSAEDDVTVKFRNLDVQVGKNSITLQGDVKTKNDAFYFMFKQGEKVLMKENTVELKKNKQGWGSFDIELEITPKVRKTEKIPLMLLYGKSDNGKKVNINHIPIDLSKKETELG